MISRKTENAVFSRNHFMRIHSAYTTLFLSALLIFLCGRNDTLFTPDPNLNGITIEAFGIDTTGIVQPIDRDSLAAHFKSSLQLLAGQPATFCGFIKGDSSLVSAIWEFGDGKESTDRIVEHTYESEGEYIARFIIKDKVGATLADTVHIAVSRVSSGGAVKGYAYFQGKISHSGIKITFNPLEQSATQITPLFTRSSGLYQVLTGFAENVYKVHYEDTLGFYSPANIDSVIIENGKLTVLPTVLLRDNHLPHIYSYSPIDTISVRLPKISALFSDTGSGISPRTFSLTVNGDTIADSLMTLDTSGFSWISQARMADGKYTIQTAISDSAGNAINVQWDFTVDAMKLTILTPDTAVRINDTVYIRSKVSDVYSKVVQYKWDFDGNGTWDDSLTIADTLVSRLHVYTHDTVYRAIEYVRDDSGMVKLDTVTINVGNLPPVISSIRPDTTISIKDSILLTAVVTDADGAIKEYAWDFEGDGTFDYTSSTQIVTGYRFNTAGTYNLVLRVTDDDNKAKKDTAVVTVLQDIPQITFFSPDTIIDHNGSIRCSVYVSQQFGVMTVEIDTVNNGTYKSIGGLGLSGGNSYSIPVGNATSWDSVKIRITDDDGNFVTRGFKVDIRPLPLTITAIDSTDCTITVHYAQTQETDFAQYRIYQNTSNSVDTNSTLWGTISASGTESYTTPTPSYAWNPRYYRIFQKDNEGLWSAGSNVVYGCIRNTPPKIVNNVYDMTDSAFMLKGYRDTIRVYNPNCHNLIFSNISSFSGISFSDSILNWVPSDTGDFDLSIQISDELGDYDTLQWKVVVGLKDIWLTLDTLSQSFQYGSQAVTLNGKIYWLGAGSNQNSVLVYDFQQKKWISIQPMNQARQGFGAGVINNKIIVAGGQQAVPLPSVEMYDPLTDTWTTKAPLNIPRAWFTLAVLDNKAYAIGGYATAGSQVDIVEEYDTLTDSWAIVDSATFLKGPYLKSCIANNQIFIARTSDFYYRSSNNNWTQLTSMQTPRYQIGMCSLGGYIYAFGGNSNTNIAERYSFEAHTWEYLAPMPSGSEEMPVVVLNDRIYVLTCGGDVHRLYVYVP